VSAAVRADVVVLGAGPAGLAAATTAAQAGAQVHLVDAAPAAGGQYWMQSPLAHPRGAPAQARAGTAAIAAACAAGVQLHLEAEVWAVFPDLRILASAPDGPLELAPRALVVATGAHDRVPPFPGWTLPGVITAGGAQRLAKLGATAAGARVVVAGSGPFLLVVARALQRAGATLVGFVEAQRPSLGLAGHLARHAERWGEMAGLLRAIASPRTQRRFGWLVTAARGGERVTAVDLAPLRADGTLDRGRSETFDDIDALVVGWGFRPAIEVTSLLRARHAYDEARGGWYCEAGPFTGQTSVPHVFAAGEVTGIAGALPAQLAGSLAGAAAAADAGFALPDPAGVANVRRRLMRARAFIAPLNRRFVPPAVIDALAADDTLVCRCECVPKSAIVEAMRDGATGVLGAKLWTRAGMGRCQGRMCSWGIARLVGGGDPAAAGFNAPRIPLRPVPLASVAAAFADDDAADPAPSAPGVQADL
jgi:NADPH-dependent 2,4-dienoyl-CoA reductase/sulfur reductase-like enzyme